MHVGNKKKLCDHELEEVPGAMYFRGRFFAGLVCRQCQYLIDNPADSMIDYAKQVYAQEHPE